VGRKSTFKDLSNEEKSLLELSAQFDVLGTYYTFVS